MSLTLYLHPLSSFCHKALIAFYENDVPFTPVVVDLSNEVSAKAFKAVWPVGRFPVLKDGERVIPESTSIIEYLARHYPGGVKLIPNDAERALETRAIDRFYDLNLHLHMQKVVGDRRRPKGRTIRTALLTPKIRSRPRSPSPTRTWRPRPGQPATTSPWPTARRRLRCSIATSPLHRSPHDTTISPPISAVSSSGRLMLAC